MNERDESHGVVQGIWRVDGRNWGEGLARPIQKSTNPWILDENFKNREVSHTLLGQVLLGGRR